MNFREITSRVIGELRLNNVDEHVPRRLILNILKSKARTFLAQKLDDRTLTQETDLYTQINCFEFQKDEIIKCPILEFRRCKTLMKSKKPLPDLIQGRYGGMIKDALSIDDFTEITVTNPQQYRRNIKRKYQLNNTVYIYVASDGYAYIPDREILAVNLLVLTVDTEKVDEISGCPECDQCKSAWDYNFIISDKLEKGVIDDTLRELIQTYKQIMPDENPNTNEYQRQ